MNLWVNERERGNVCVYVCACGSLVLSPPRKCVRGAGYETMFVDEREGRVLQ